MTERRRYTHKDRTKVVAIASLRGQRAASRETGVPIATVHDWFQKPEFEQLRTRKKEEVEAAFWIGIQIGLKAVVDGFAGEADLGKKAVAFGVLYDKHALMTGQATSRNEHKDVTSSFSDEEWEQLNGLLREAAHARD